MNLPDGNQCGDVLSLPAKEAVRKECVLPKGHDGYCRSGDGRMWETGKGRHV